MSDVQVPVGAKEGDQFIVIDADTGKAARYVVKNGEAVLEGEATEVSLSMD